MKQRRQPLISGEAWRLVPSRTQWERGLPRPPQARRRGSKGRKEAAIGH